MIIVIQSKSFEVNLKELEILNNVVKTLTPMKQTYNSKLDKYDYTPLNKGLTIKPVIKVNWSDEVEE